jgi:hypothetical protein
VKITTLYKLEIHHEDGVDEDIFTCLRVAATEQRQKHIDDNNCFSIIYKAVESLEGRVVWKMLVPGVDY